MTPFFLVYILSILPSQGGQAAPHNPSVGKELSYTNQAQEPPQEEIKDLKKGILGLEFYIRDKKDHKAYCSHIEWKQPSLNVYKKDPKSYLPANCSVETE